MILSDVSIRAAIEVGRIEIDPFDPSMVQPSSIDVRVDRYVRVFENHRYPYIDPKQPQPDLTTEVVTEMDVPFVLHPG
ncbi:MAG TPA: dCTP deaminase, partial [Acidimicrobiia bacterium]|nr:dCTP deaminase [Acidimicrobiia bacterium]